MGKVIISRSSNSNTRNYYRFFFCFQIQGITNIHGHDELSMGWYIIVMEFLVHETGAMVRCKCIISVDIMEFHGGHIMAMEIDGPCMTCNIRSFTLRCF